VPPPHFTETIVPGFPKKVECAKKPNTDRQLASLCSAFPEILAFAVPDGIFSITALCTETEAFQGVILCFGVLGCAHAFPRKNEEGRRTGFYRKNQDEKRKKRSFDPA